MTGPEAFMQEQPPIHCWGVSAELRPLLGGHRNLAFRTVGLPHDLVFKSTRRSREAIAWLSTVHALAQQSGFVVPTLLKSTGGQYLVDGWTCEAFIHGRAFLPSDIPSIRREISRFHRLTENVPQRPGFLSARDLLTATKGGDVDLDKMPADLVETCRRAWHKLGNGRHAVVHGDLTPGNLVRCADGRAALLDWDECRRDHPQFDIGCLGPACATVQQALWAWETACSWEIEPVHALQVAARLC
ncbi:MAG: aminoglycoside phosphotransferase family protein [Paracoccaceae bacterium]|nr:aminoglycoside phosphotransferase family protein [Paracoccaceae bacterium]